MRKLLTTTASTVTLGRAPAAHSGRAPSVGAMMLAVAGLLALSNQSYALEPIDQAEPVEPVIHVEPVFPIDTPDEARTWGLESLRAAVEADGGAPLPANLDQFVRDRAAAIQLGKALFWDMQVGSDGIQACASCHYSAGADNRARNQINPGLLNIVDDRTGDIEGYFDAPASPDKEFNTVRPDGTVKPLHYPFVKYIQKYTRNEDGSIGPFRGNSNDVTSSMGIHFTDFKGTPVAKPVDWGTRLASPIFSSEAGSPVRRVPPRNAPTTINAVFNFTQFWDGKANPIFNGQTPFGQQDTDARVWVRQSDGSVVQESIVLKNASLASQAVGPALSHFEMSFGNPAAGNARTFPELGKKLLRARDGLPPIVPLAQQIVSLDDSVLGGLSLSPSQGLNIQYRQLIEAAFKPEYWDYAGRLALGQAKVAPYLTAGRLTVKTVDGISADATAAEAATEGMVEEAPTETALTDSYANINAARFTQAEANFSMFFGISIMMYEGTLIADETPFDKWMETGVLDEAFGTVELEGLNVFTGKGKCVNCHGGPELTNASVRNAQKGNNMIEPMPMAEGLALYDNGFYNIGVTPTTDDIGRGGKDLNGKPLAFTRQALFDRFDIQEMGFPIIGNDKIHSRGEFGNVVCDDDDLNGFCDPGPSIATEFQRVAVDGAFKTPGLRNVELTGPYFHNGGSATLKQVVELYNRGGNFCNLNLHDLDPDIRSLGLSDDEQNQLTAFMVALTDTRVKYSRAPFDHPQLLIPSNGWSKLRDIPAIGASGSDTALETFLGLDPQESIFTPAGLCSNGVIHVEPPEPITPVQPVVPPVNPVTPVAPVIPPAGC
jgi:cytochrome c peroxidase